MERKSAWTANPLAKPPLKDSVKVAAGHHRVEAMLEGYRTEQSEIDVSGQGHVEMMLKLQALAPAAALVTPVETKPAPTTTNVSISPALAPQAGPTPIARNDSAQSQRQQYPESSSSGGVQRAIGYVIASAGLIGGGIGIAFAVDGQSKHDDAVKQFENGDKAGARLTESDSSNEKTKGYVIIGAGGAAMLTGAILLISAPSGDSGNARTRFSPWVAANSAGASLGGSW